MSQIKTYCRIKPSPCHYEDYDSDNTTLQLRVREAPCDHAGHCGLQSARPITCHHFTFTEVFSPVTSQAQVFDTVAKPVVQGFLDGYNGTIFAYGQTGSGKTYTVEGTPSHCDGRGIAPRAISMIYRALESCKSLEDMRIHVSYMEIYQESGYDLLDTTQRGSNHFASFPKVSVGEGSQGSCQLRNLSCHQAATEEVAQKFLSQGQANRKVAETSMNQQSSRSHSIFTLHLTVRHRHTPTIKKSKLHLVDLAGSERVAKTGTEGRLLVEAKYINLSLHHLQNVIVALQKDTSRTGSRKLTRPRSAPHHLLNRATNGRPTSACGYYGNMFQPWPNQKHIPYRNSLLTMILRDSIGGNSHTAMIATVSMEEVNLCETLSTCRFAQRVACITNSVRKNEEIDEKKLIHKLKERIHYLEKEVASLRAGQHQCPVDPFKLMEADMTDEDKMECIALLRKYLPDDETGLEVNCNTGSTQWKECLALLKKMIISSRDQAAASIDCEQIPGEQIRFKGKGNSSLSSTAANLASSKNEIRVQKGSFENRKRVAKLDSQTFKIIRDSKTGGNVPTSKKSRVCSEKRKGLTQRRVQSAGCNRSSVVRRASAVPSKKGAKDSTGTIKVKQKETTGSLLSHQSQDAPHAQVQPLQDQLDQVPPAQVQPLQNQLAQVHLHQQKLVLIRTDLSKNLERFREQVSQQQAYLHTLRHTSTDSKLIEQETLVLKQLEKKVAKLERRIQMVEEQLTLMTQCTVPPACTLPNASDGLGQGVEGVGQGARGTGQQNEEAELENDKVLVLSMQIQLKEAATRKKLEELRQKLQKSNMPVSLHTAAESINKLDVGDNIKDPDHNHQVRSNVKRPKSSPLPGRKSLPHYEELATYHQYKQEATEKRHYLSETSTQDGDIDNRQTDSVTSEERPQGRDEWSVPTNDSKGKMSPSNSSEKNSLASVKTLRNEWSKRVQIKKQSPTPIEISSQKLNSIHVCRGKDQNVAAYIHTAKLDHPPVSDPAYMSLPLALRQTDKSLTLKNPDDNKWLDDNDRSLLLENSIQMNFDTLREELMQNLSKYKLDSSTSETNCSDGFPQFKDSEEESHLSNNNEVPPRRLSQTSIYSADTSEKSHNTQQVSSQNFAQDVQEAKVIAPLEVKDIWKEKLKSLLEKNPQFRPQSCSNKSQSDNTNGISQYIQFNHLKDKSTFEFALSKMLEDNPGDSNLNYSQRHYDTFARTPKIPNEHYDTSVRHPKGMKSQAKGKLPKLDIKSKNKDLSPFITKQNSPWKQKQEPEYYKNNPYSKVKDTRNWKEPEDIWGPEAKHLSVKDQLEKYLLIDSAMYQPGSMLNQKKTRGRGCNNHNNAEHLNFNLVSQSVEDDQDDMTFPILSSRTEKRRVSQIRKFWAAAEVIQRSWKRYKHKCLNTNEPGC